MKVYALMRYQLGYSYDAEPALVKIFASKKAIEIFFRKQILPLYNTPKELSGGRPYGIKRAMKEGGYLIREREVLSVAEVSVMEITNPEE